MAGSRVWEIVFVRAVAELKVEASRAYIGILWWVAEPLLYMMAFYLLFGLGLRFGGDNYVAFLLCGLVPYKWFSSSISTGANAIVGNRALINLVYVPKFALVFSVLLANVFKFLIVLGLLVLFLAVSGVVQFTAWVYLPVVIFAQLLLTAGLAGISSMVVPVLPDFRLIIDNGLLLLFFTSGIFYDVAEKTPHLLEYISFNPLFGLVEGYRAILLDGNAPDLGSLVYVVGLGCAFLILAMTLLMRFDRRISRITI